jgi:hypothetical protein
MTHHDVELPPFLYGSFDWRFNGLHWDRPAPFDLLSAEALASSDPWIVLASVVARAREGNHRDALHLVPFFRCHEPFALARVSMLVFADLAPLRDLLALEEMLRGDDAELRSYAAQAASLSGWLRLVPAMLDAWNRAETIGNRETIGFALSDMLEAGSGAIADQANVVNTKFIDPSTLSPELARWMEEHRESLQNQDPPRFPGLVLDSLRSLEATHGPDAIVFGGELWNVVRFAEKVLTDIKSPQHAVLYTHRHRFEAATGVDCRNFFHPLGPQKLEIAATLENFLASTPPDSYESGVRYFFGHRIPD